MNLHHPKSLPVTQRGVALIVVLILLLVMTLLGLASLRGSLLEDRMTSGEYDRSLAFQAAEGALREAEARLNTPPFPVFPTSDPCVTGLCAKPVPTAGYKDRWNDLATVWNPATISVGLGIAPVYIIELMGPAANWFGCDQEVPMQPNCLTPRYRITARSAATNRAAVTLQSTYAAH